VLAVVLAAVFIRLGVWQLDRHAQRVAENEKTRQSLAMPPAPYQSLRYEVQRANRHTVVQGIPDYDHEFVYAGRSRNGSPGVHIFTPIRTGETTAVLVNRGWVYASDAATVDLTRWREKRRTFGGYARELPLPLSAAPPSVNGAPAGGGRVVRSITRRSIEGLLPYPFHSLYVVARDSAGGDAPARLPEPDLTNGPHLSYAIQWFCFASIALTGAAVVWARSRRRSAGSPAA
jgi:surfeit locus 1 family protein